MVGYLSFVVVTLLILNPGVIEDDMINFFTLNFLCTYISRSLSPSVYASYKILYSEIGSYFTPGKIFLRCGDEHAISHPVKVGGANYFKELAHFP